MSHVAGCITLAGRVLYAVYVPLDGGLRLRLSVDEWESLGIPAGARVNVAIPGEPRSAYFIRSAVFVEPGWMWVECNQAPVQGRQGLTRFDDGWAP